MTTRSRRPAFTLLELIVVMALILALAGLTLLFYPDLSDQQRAPRGATLVQQTLLNAKNRALRDRAARGVRLKAVPVDPNNPVQFQPVGDLLYLEQPDDFVVQPGVAKDPFDATRFLPFRRISTGVNAASTIVLEPADPAATTVNNFSGGGGADQTLWPVQAGDYLEVNGGRVYQITAVAADGNSLTLASPVPQALALVANYRILRGPRVSSDDPVSLPADIIIDLNTNTQYGNPLPLNTVTKTVDILFSPSGAVIGRGTAGDALYLWVRDSTVPDPKKGDPTLVTIQVRTGAVLAYPVDNVSPDPYALAKTGRASGL
jgi:prepilin-type N-terminal cleavage/methylation domain-containing protein